MVFSVFLNLAYGLEHMDCSLSYNLFQILVCVKYIEIDKFYYLNHNNLMTEFLLIFNFFSFYNQ